MRVDQFTHLVVLILLAGYLLPTWIGMARQVRGLGLLFVLNVLLGWTWIAWAILLYMACVATGGPSNDEPILARAPGRRIEPPF